MTVITGQVEKLPEGWTRHGLASNTFYYHAATNTVQQEPPAVTEPELPAAAAAASPAAAEPATEAPAPPPAPAAPLAPAAAAAAAEAVYMAQPVHAAAAAAASVAPQPAAAPALQQLQVLVPAPGLTTGQQMAFQTPAGPGQAPRNMVVVSDRDVAPNSVMTVAYPAPQQQMQQPPNTISQPAAMATSLPEPQMRSAESLLEEDRRAMNTSWWLFAGGCCCFFCGITPLGPVVWVASAAWYFCKPKAERMRRPQQRRPAVAAASSCCLVAAALICFALVAVVIQIANDVNDEAPRTHVFEHHMEHKMDHAVPAVASLRGAVHEQAVDGQRLQILPMMQQEHTMVHKPIQFGPVTKPFGKSFNMEVN